LADLGVSPKWTEQKEGIGLVQPEAGWSVPCQWSIRYMQVPDGCNIPLPCQHGNTILVIMADDIKAGFPHRYGMERASGHAAPCGSAIP